MTTTQLFDLSERIALVTGGSNGLGRQMAFGLAEAGCSIVIANRSIDAGRETATEIAETTGARTLAVPLDVTERESAVEAVRRAEEHFGPIDILINCAGISLNTNLEPSAENTSIFRKILDVNVTGIFHCSSAVATSMKKRRRGRIINVSSIYGANGIDRLVYIDDIDSEFALHGYAASKGAVCNLTRDLASTLGPWGITVNAILPATFITDQNRHLFSKNVLERIVRRTPLGRVGTDDDLKGVAVFLSSDASKYVTGQLLAVDGGWLAW